MARVPIGKETQTSRGRSHTSGVMTTRQAMGMDTKGGKVNTKSGRARVSAKIRHLRKEGVKPEQAVAMALSMERAHRLGPRGGYRRVPKGR